MEDRALSPDMLCRDSEGPDCRDGQLPDASTGQDPGTLARSPERSEGSRCKEGMAQCRAVGPDRSAASVRGTKI